MTTFDVRSLADDLTRASFLADHVDNPEGALEYLAEQTDAFLASLGEDKLPEDLCGPVMATVGACMVGSLMTGFDGPEGQWTGDPIELLMKSQITAQTIEHAAYGHSDPLALAMVSTETIEQTYEAIVEWVSLVLWDSADLDPALVLVLDDLDDSGPEAA